MRYCSMPGATPHLRHGGGLQESDTPQPTVMTYMVSVYSAPDELHDTSALLPDRPDQTVQGDPCNLFDPDNVRLPCSSPLLQGCMPWC